jgi:hypothetical protein
MQNARMGWFKSETLNRHKKSFLKIEDKFFAKQLLNKLKNILFDDCFAKRRWIMFSSHYLSTSNLSNQPIMGALRGSHAPRMDKVSKKEERMVSKIWRLLDNLLTAPLAVFSSFLLLAGVGMLNGGHEAFDVVVAFYAATASGVVAWAIWLSNEPA